MFGASIAVMERETIESYVDATAAMLALPLLPEHRPGVLAYFELAAGLAELVMAQPLRHDQDPAPVFVPIAPGDAPWPDKRRVR